MPERAATPRRVFRDPALQEEFEREGFVMVDALSPAEAASMRDEALALVDPALPINDPQQALYGTLFDEERRCAGEELADRALGGLIDALLDEFRYEGGFLVGKPGGSGRLDLHQHQPVTSDIYQPTVHAWLTLDDCGAESGGLRVVRGSHALTRHVQSFESPAYFRSFASTLEESYAEPLAMRAGQAVIFERSLIHGSERNCSEQPRLRLLGTAIPAESALCILAESVAGTFEAFEVGAARVEPDLYCIANENRMGLRSRGVIANRNLELTEEEFANLLALGKRVAPDFDPIDEVRGA